jgi:carbon-monoxide dehydrogenase medium subunit
MGLHRFEYFGCNTIEEAYSLLSRYKDKARVICGGTDLRVKIQDKKTLPKYLIGLKGIPNLDYIEYDEAKGLRIGTSATLSAVRNSSLIRDKFGILAQAVSQMATPQIRNWATVGGNLCFAAPSADTAPSLIALGAKLVLANREGERIIPLEEFFTGPSETVLGDEELLLEIQVPKMPPQSGGVYIKYGLRKSMSLAIVGVATIIALDSAGQMCQDVRIVLGAVAPTPIRANKAESILRGKRIENKLIDEAAYAAEEEARPISDVRSSVGYRKEMVKILTRKAINQSWEKAKMVAEDNT